jgi:hypothetical protein
VASGSDNSEARDMEGRSRERDKIHDSGNGCELKGDTGFIGISLVQFPASGDISGKDSE